MVPEPVSGHTLPTSRSMPTGFESATIELPTIPPMTQAADIPVTASSKPASTSKTSKAAATKSLKRKLSVAKKGAKANDDKEDEEEGEGGPTGHSKLDSIEFVWR